MNIETLSTWQRALVDYFRAPMPGLVIETVEEQRVLTDVYQVLQYLALNQGGKRECLLWSSVSTATVKLYADGTPSATNPPVPFFKTVQDFAKPEKEATATTRAEHAARVLVIRDFGGLFEAPQNVRVLREALFEIRATRKTIILLGTKHPLPTELVPEFVILPYALPTQPDFIKDIEVNVAAVRSKPQFSGLVATPQAMADFSRACCGLTRKEMLSILSLVLTRYQAIDDRAVELALAEKAQIIRRSSVLTYETIRGGLDDIGGLSNIKQWIREKTPLFVNPQRARDFGCTPPSGLLICGISGTGKSYISKLFAAHLKVPLITFDLGRAFDKMLGGTEKNLREVMELTNAVKPCVVRIDEIEKGLGGGDGDTDGGTTGRFKSTFLTWLVEKSDEIFVIATANNLEKFAAMPELLNKHRFSECFFVDLPAKAARIEVLDIHLRKRRHPIPVSELGPIADATVNCSGAELEAVVKSAVDSAFFAGHDRVTVEHLMVAASNTVPLARTMSESINRLRQWCNEGRARRADDATPESETVPTATASDSWHPVLG